MAILLAALLVGLDQITKLLVVNSMALGESIPVGLGFAVTHSRNTGAAFGLLRDLNFPLGPLDVDGTFLLGLLSAAVTVFLVVYLWRNGGKLSTLAGASLGLVLAGAAGNMIDRFRLGYVVDFIHFRVGWFDFPVFNVADSCVVVGAGLLILSSFLHPPQAGEEPAGNGELYKRAPLPRQRALEEMPELPPLERTEQGDGA